ncbi:MAG: R3H domain-containing nucleic acid-binding protein [bacterium]|nr:R3H domain-containing nucleic acid-binding protein [bacterium]
MDTDTPITNSDQETIRKTTEALLRLMGFGDVSVSLRQQNPEEPLMVSVSVPDAGILIGDRGVNLIAFEYVTKLLTRKLAPLAPRYVIDINNYREQKFSELREYARAAASRATREQREIELEPMLSIERRVVHTELASRPDITTESKGEGESRHIVVKPLA